MKIQLNLIISVIKEAVKAETYIKGSIDRAAGNDQQATNAVAYHETAGDEEVHERKIMRGIYTSADKLRSYIQDYLDVTGSNVGDNNTLTVDSDNDAITITMDVGDRFNKANTDALARLFSQYIENNCLVMWWGTINQQQMQYYASLLGETIASIQRLFIKRAPSAPSPTYTTTLTLGVSEFAVSGSDLVMVVGNEQTVTYSIDEDVVDDIDAVSDQPYTVGVEKDGYGIRLIPKKVGVAKVKFFSRHNDLVSKTLNVIVEEED